MLIHLSSDSTRQAAQSIGTRHVASILRPRSDTNSAVPNAMRLCELFSVSPDDISSEGMGLSSRAMVRRGGTRDVTMAMPALFPAYRIVEGPSGSSLKPLDPVFAPMDVAEKHAGSIFLRTNDAGVSRTIPKDSFVLVAAVVDGTRMLIRRYSTGNSMVMLSANSYEPTMGDDLVLDRRRVKILGTCVWWQATHDLTT